MTSFAPDNRPTRGPDADRRRSRVAWRGVVWAVLAACVVAMPAASSSSPQQGGFANWPQWRGPDGNGVSSESRVRVRFSADDGVKWKFEIPGRGNSSPIVWDDLVFVTTAVPHQQEPGPGARPRRRSSRLVPHDFRIIAVRRSDGSPAWSRTAVIVEPHEGYHRTLSSYANASPVTDGSLVFAFFGSRGLYAYDFDGKPAWNRDFGVQMNALGEFGEGSSPALHGDTLVVLFDHQGQSFIEAVDKHTGATLWKRLRDEDTSWSSPVIVELDDRVLVVASGSKAVTAYDLASGDVAWTSAGMTPYPIPTPVAGLGLLFAASGSTERRIHAIDLGGFGSPGAVTWRHDKGAPYNPSPLLWGSELYVVRDGGLNSGTSRLSLLDALTGEPAYSQEKLPGGYSVRGSPVGAGEHLYVSTEEGDVLVIRRGPAFEVVAVNSMEEAFVASPAIAHDEIFLRGSNHLFCIAAPGG